MRTIKAIGIPLLAILVGCTMLVGAVSMCWSNVVENVNTASHPVTLSIETTDATPGIDLPNYTATAVMFVNQSYDMLLNYTTTVGILDSIIAVKFTKASMNLTDVNMTWYDVGTTTWKSVELTSSGDVLRGTLDAQVPLSAEGSMSYYANLTYMAPGNYTFESWVECELA